MQLIEIDRRSTPHTLEAEPASPDRDVVGSPADANWLAASDSRFMGRCSLWWRGTPQLEQHRVGLIGGYSAIDSTTAQALLRHACRQLRAQGCTIAVGPMDGNTWGNYRFVTHAGEHPPFWMEPVNSAEGPLHFEQAGFRSIAHYFSAINVDLHQRVPRLRRVAERLHASGVRFRSIGEATYDEDVGRIYAVAKIAFRNNLLYSELPEREFRQQTARLRPFVPLDLCWLAERDGQSIGFLFAVPDLEEKARESRIRTLIIKTLAALPGRRNAGLGQLLLADVQRRARDFGYTRAIHALMRENGSMSTISGRYAQPIRRYALLARELPS